jgi:DNA-binding NarL/FixJ family response regulator
MIKRDYCATCARGPCARHLAAAQLRRRSRDVVLACVSVDADSLKIRPYEIVQCVLCGDSNPNIAERLDISVSTVKYHLRRVVTRFRATPTNDI